MVGVGLALVGEDQDRAAKDCKTAHGVKQEDIVEEVFNTHGLRIGGVPTMVAAGEADDRFVA